MNALKSIALKVFTVAIATGAAFAASDTVTITLPESVTLGGSTLAAGRYTVTESAASDGSLFIFRSDKGQAVAALGERNAEPSADQKTEVVLSREGDTLHLDKLFIAGESAGYQFPESK